MSEDQFQLIRDDGTTFPVAANGLTLGRSRQNVVVITDAGVSRHHATLLLARGRCWIRDEGSTHGTFVNGQAVPGQQELRVGDVLQIGQAALRLERVHATSAVQTQSGPSAQRRRMVIWGVVSAVAIVAIVGIGLITGSGNSGSEYSEVRVSPDKGGEVSLSDGAYLSILPGGFPEETTVSLRQLGTEKYANSVSGTKVIGPVYQLEANQVSSGFDAVLVLPYSPQGLSESEQQKLTIAYHDAGRWISIPSTVDTETNTISAHITHFTDYATKTQDDLIQILPEPPIYTGVKVEEGVSSLASLDDLVINVNVTDREKKLFGVYLALQAEFHESGFLPFWQDLDEHMKDSCKAEAETEAEKKSCLQLAEDLSPPEALSELTWVELIEQEPGHYQHKLDLDKLKSKPNSQLLRIRIYVMAFPSLIDDPVEKQTDVLFSSDAILPPTELISPGPHSQVFCPARPIFKWESPYTELHLEKGAMQLLVARGTNLWKSHRYVYKPIFSTQYYDEELIIMSGEWLPDDNLADGKRYCWGIILSPDGDKKKFDNDSPLNTPSGQYCFSVDHRIKGSDCLPYIKIVNDSAEKICTVNIVSATSDTWGENQLGPKKKISSGDSRRFYIEAPGLYNVRVEDCSGNIDERQGIEVADVSQPFIVAFSPTDRDDLQTDGQDDDTSEDTPVESDGEQNIEGEAVVKLRSEVEQEEDGSEQSAEEEADSDDNRDASREVPDGQVILYDARHAGGNEFAINPRETGYTVSCSELEDMIDSPDWELKEDVRPTQYRILWYVPKSDVTHYAFLLEETREQCSNLDLGSGSDRAADVPKPDMASEPTQESPETLASLVSWWSGDGNALDSIGSNDGTPQGGLTFAQGIAGQAFSFSGADDHVNIGNPASLNSFSSGITLEAWIMPNATTSGINAIITKWGQSNSTDAYGIYLEGSAGDLRLLGGIGVPGISDNGIRGGVVPADQWSHVAMTYDNGTGVNILYVNGELVAERVRPGGITQSSLNVLIGRENSHRPRPFKGLIDQVRIFNRALSSDEIKAIIESTSSSTVDIPSTSGTSASNNSPEALTSTWLAGRCQTHPPTRIMNVYVELTDKPDQSFGVYLHPNGECHLSSVSAAEADVVVTIAGDDLIGLLNGSIWYSTLINNGRISVVGKGRSAQARGPQNDFLYFLLDSE